MLPLSGIEPRLLGRSVRRLTVYVPEENEISRRNCILFPIKMLHN
jgi:hypothetical protein